MNRLNACHIFLAILIACFSLTSYAQVTATPSAGCLPLTVNFTSPPGATGILWNFGNSITSNVANPSNNYTSAGTYTVTLNCNLGTFTTLVVVHPKPVANFTFTQPSSGCAVKTVSFTDQSSAPAGSSLLNWQWTYGDGGSGTNSGNHTYGYTVAGSFSVTLKVTDNNNCDNTVTKGVIHVSAQPTLVISNTGLNSCASPFTTSFSGSNCASGSPLGGGLTYNWSFGNGGPGSSSQNPGSITYSAQGNYNVILTVTDNNNCSRSNTVQVSVNQPAVKIKMKDTVCLNTPLFVRDSSNVPITTWNMGDGNSTSLNTTSSPVLSQSVHVYTTPGNYTISITATSGTCSSTITKTIHVQQVIANFTTSLPSYTCGSHFLAPMINQSSPNATTYTWTYQTYNPPTVTTSTLQNPTFTYVVNSLNPYHIYSVYNPTISLQVKSAFGCISGFSFHAYDSIMRPSAWFSVNKREGCAPLAVTFKDSTFTRPVYPVTSYTWNNGANPATLVSGSIPPPIVNPTFTYTSPGTYTPYLIVQTAGGCIDTSFVDTITVVNPPVISFSVSPSIACWNQPIQITNTSPATNPPIQHWHVQSDNSFFSHCINDPNPSGLFTHFGTHTFTMSGYHHGCKGTSASTQTVYIKGPIVQGRFETNCATGQRKNIIFRSSLQDAQYATLNFGDGTPVFTITGTPNAVANHSITHSYAATGDYTATLTGYNVANGCAPYTYTMQVKVRDVSASFTLPAVACASVGTLYDASASTDVFASCGRGYIWYFNNLPPVEVTTPTLNYALPAAGLYTVTLYVRDVNGCSDTAQRTIRMSSAAAGFTFGANPLCYSTGTVQMVNTTSGLPDPITSYFWNSGGVGTSTLSSPVFNYGNTFVPPPGQTFTVNLVAINSIGCIDTVRHTLQVNNPSSYIFPSQSNICTGTSVSFITPQGYPNYTFTFGPSTQSLATTNYTAAYTYTAHGSFNASVTVQDAGGCFSTSYFPVNVQSFPTASFSINAANSVNGNNICSGAPVTFSDASTSNYPLSYNWDLNTGSAIVNNSVVVNTYTASQNSVVPISLTVSTTNGCSSVFTNTFNIFVAKADINLDKSVICLGESIKVNLKDTTSVHAWVWGFGDGTPTHTVFAGPSNPSFTLHPYTFYPAASNGTTTLSLIYFSSQLACRYSVDVPITIRRIDANFIRNTETLKSDSIHCIGKPDTFSNTTPNSSNYTFNWDFGNGVTSTQANPNYTYPNAGVYTVSLTVKDPANNCIGTTVKNMTVHALPDPRINGPDSVCQNKPFSLNGLSAGSVPIVSYQWTPSVGLSQPNGPATTVTASVATQYSLTITDLNGCSNGTTSSVFVQEPPLPVQWDTTIIIGQNITVNGYAGSNMSYTWSPNIAISCTSCTHPLSTTTANIVYSVTVADNMGCFSRVNTYSIEVLPKSSVDVPTAFTPNGDGKNDIIYVSGWGIKKLNYFRIFNRWGQLLFESNDIRIGWDGLFNGVPQNMETYVYQVSAETFVDDNALLKTGTFKLIR